MHVPSQRVPSSSDCAPLGLDWCLLAIFGVLLFCIPGCTSAEIKELDRSWSYLLVALVLLGIETIGYYICAAWHLALTIKVTFSSPPTGFHRLSRAYFGLAGLAALGFLLGLVSIVLSKLMAIAALVAITISSFLLLVFFFILPLVLMQVGLGGVASRTHRKLANLAPEEKFTGPLLTLNWLCALVPIFLLVVGVVTGQSERSVKQQESAQHEAALQKRFADSADEARKEQAEAERASQHNASCSEWTMLSLRPAPSPGWQSNYFKTDAENAIATRITTAQLLPTDVGPKLIVIPCTGEESGQAFGFEKSALSAYARALLSPKLWTLDTEPSELALKALDQLQNDSSPQTEQLAKHIEKLAGTARTPLQQQRARQICRAVQALRGGLSSWPSDVRGNCKKLAQKITTH